MSSCETASSEPCGRAERAGYAGQIPASAQANILEMMVGPFFKDDDFEPPLRVFGRDGL
jgi:hypothetical protein